MAQAREALDSAEAVVAEQRSAWESADASMRAAEQAVAEAKLQEAAPQSSLTIPLLVLSAALVAGGAVLLGIQAVLGGALLLAGAAAEWFALRGAHRRRPSLRPVR